MEATKNETFAEIFKTGTYKIPATNLVSDERPLTTTNYLVDDHVITQFMSSRYRRQARTILPFQTMQLKL
ncbi:MAG: hypothetical protein BHW31_01600 [Firmicutes bacterium CAG:110_56_8]|nr:MAG: hypothetical protein BHW31_01600 [Firmicutes bacterium CAG:110_56_8]